MREWIFVAIRNAKLLIFFWKIAHGMSYSNTVIKKIRQFRSRCQGTEHVRNVSKDFSIRVDANIFNVSNVKKNFVGFA